MTGPFGGCRRLLRAYDSRLDGREMEIRSMDASLERSERPACVVRCVHPPASLRGQKDQGARGVTAPLFQFLVRISPDRPGPRRVGGAMDPDVLVSHLDDFRDVLININDDVSALEPDTRPVTPRVDRAPNQAPPRLKTLLGDPARSLDGKTDGTPTARRPVRPLAPSRVFPAHQTPPNILEPRLNPSTAHAQYTAVARGVHV